MRIYIVYTSTQTSNNYVILSGCYCCCFKMNTNNILPYSILFIIIGVGTHERLEYDGIIFVNNKIFA